MAKKNYHNYLSIFIESKLSNLMNRDKKKYTEIKNIVGININYDKPKNSDLYIKNNHSRKNFLKNVDLIERLIKLKNNL